MTTDSAPDPASPQDGTPAGAGRIGAGATEVPADVEPAGRCPYCQRPFPTERRLSLHLGEIHEDVLTDSEQAAYEEALAAERDDLFYFHMKVVVVLGVLYALTVLLYMVALGSGLL